MPAVAQTIIAQVREAVVDPPKEVGDFECAGKAAIDGKEYLTYRSIEKGGADARGSTAPKDVHRTVYVDPESGLPAVNIVKEDKPDAAPIFKGTYAYPKDLVIDAPSRRAAGAHAIGIYDREEMYARSLAPE